MFAVEAATASPIDRVVTLLTELKAKIEADGKAEQKIYDKYACWCEQTTAAKAKDIADSKEYIEELSTEIEKRKGQLGSLTAELSQLTKDIGDNEKSTSQAKALRQKQHQEYLQTKNELEEAVGALDKAIRALAGAGTGAGLITVAADLRGALQLAPKDSVSDRDMSSIRDFLSNPASFAQSGATVKGVDSYAPASNEIQGILKDMHTTFIANLEGANHEEAEQRKTHEDLMSAKEKELAEMQSTLEKKEAENAEATKVEADSQQDREDTSEQLEADEKFFEETKEGCRDKASEWAERTRLRTEELAGIEKAMEVLTSPEASRVFEGASSTFVQTEAVKGGHKALSASVQRAAALVDAAARSSHNLALLLLAADMKMTGHFDKIIFQIDRMVDLMRAEEKEDIAAKESCDEAKAKNDGKKADIGTEIDRLDTALNKLADKKKEQEDNIEAIEKRKTNLIRMMDEGQDQRNAEHEKFVQAVKDDEDAVALLGQAIESIEAFYKNNPDQAALLTTRATLMRKQEPAPTADFNSAKTTETTGVISIMEMIKEDLENEVKAARTEEGQAQLDFNSALTDFKADMETLNNRIADIQNVIAEIEMRIAAKKMEKDGANKRKEAVLQAETKLKPSCDWVENTFDKRRSARKVEMDGLIEAKAVLAGADQAEADAEDTALITKTTFMSKTHKA